MAVRGFSERHAERGGGGGGGGEGHRACRFDQFNNKVVQKMTQKNKVKQKKKKGREDLYFWGLGFTLKRDKKKGEEGDSLSTMNKNGRFCSRAIHAPTHQHPSSTKPALNGIVSRTFVAFVRVGREKRRSRGSRRLPFSLSFFLRRTRF